jgi:Zn2+/Cd2+-exporting ATPase
LKTHFWTLLKQNLEIRFTFLGSLSLLAGALLQFIFKADPLIYILSYLPAYLLCGYYPLKDAIRSTVKGHFDIDLLMILAAAGAAVLGEWGEGALLLFLFSLGHAMEHYAISKAERSIASLADLSARVAQVWKADQWVEVPVEKLQVGDKVLIIPNQKIPADGFIVKGEGPVNEAPITGESLPSEKKAVTTKKGVSEDDFQKLDRQFKLFAGSIAGDQAMEIQVAKVGNDTSLGRLIEHVKNAQQKKSGTQKSTDKLIKYYVPAVLAIVVLLLFVFLVHEETFEQSFYRAMAVLVAASPCALAISTPSAMLSGIARAAQEGVLMKGGKALEELQTCNILAFDKTGTLTTGKPTIKEIYLLPDQNEQECLQEVYSLELMSTHPLALAIVRDLKTTSGDSFLPLAVTEFAAISGKGLMGHINGESIMVGNLAMMQLHIEAPVPPLLEDRYTQLKASGHSYMFVAKAGKYIAGIAMKDTLRPETPALTKTLKDMGYKRLIMLSGDLKEAAEEIGRESGVTEVYGGLLPEEKVKAILDLQAEGNRVTMIGDGINDAPAMAESTLGVAMGAIGSDLAMETADVVLMSDKIEKLPFVILLSRKTNQIVRQNIAISMGMVLILVPLTALDVLSMGPAVLLHEGSTVVVVLNALRLLRFHKNQALTV